MDARAFLVQRATGDDAGRQWPLAAGVTTIGRDAASDIPIPDREISRHHAQVRHDGTRFVLVDLGSKNGTRLNGRPLEGAAPLADGDELTLGTRARFLFMDADATLPARGTPRVRIDPKTKDVFVGNCPLDPPLAPNQFRLLSMLAGQPGRVFTRDEIAQACYAEAQGGVSDQAIDGVVRRLRARLAEAQPDSTAALVVAVRGHGFKLRP